jgi:molybdopterin-guanine dinucleotide biosynthesis protein A
LAAGLTACRTGWLLCVPCDCPALPLDLAARLHQAVSESAATMAVVRTSEGLQPTFQLCRRDLLPVLTDYLAAGRRKVGEWCRQQGAVEVPFDAPDAFRNLNTREDLV